MYKLKEKYEDFMNKIFVQLQKDGYEVKVFTDLSDEYLVVFINGKSFHIGHSSFCFRIRSESKYTSLLIEPEKIKNKNSQYDELINQYKSIEEQFEIAITYLKSIDEIKEPLNLFVEKISNV